MTKTMIKKSLRAYISSGLLKDLPLLHRHMIRILFFQLFKELIYGALIFLVLFLHRSVFQQIHQR